MGSIYCIGDIHGCLDKLTTLMGMIVERFRPGEDSLIFLGDYIDRGPDSFQVVEYLIDWKNRYPETIFLKGNHEEMFGLYLVGLDRYTYMVNGGQQTLESYLQNNPWADMYSIPKAHVDFLASLLLYYESDAFIFVHAGIKEGVSLHKQATEDLLWIREKFVRSEYDFGKRVVFGHTPFPQPLVQKNKIGIDTGAVYGNKLTCVILPEMEFIQA
jgi:serine/threonine protein phosphatase 1